MVLVGSDDIFRNTVGIFPINEWLMIIRHVDESALCADDNNVRALDYYSGMYESESK